MKIILNETDDDPVVTPVAGVTEKVIVEGAANYAPAGPPGPPGTTDWDGITDKPTEFPPGEHQHSVTDLSGVVKTVNGQAPDGSGDVVVAAGGGYVSQGAYVPVGKVFAVTRSQNSSFSFGAVAGHEYAVGVYLGPCSIDRVAIQVTGTGADPGTIFRVGLRPITQDGFGPPVVDAAFDVTNVGVLWVDVAEAALEGFYALSWMSQHPNGATRASMQRSLVEANSNIIPISWNYTFPATGHGPAHAVLNSGVVGALPSSVSPLDVGTNTEGGYVPQIVVRRSA